MIIVDIVASHLKAEKNASVIAKLQISHQKKQIHNKEIKSFFFIFFNFLNHKIKNGLKSKVHKKCSKKTIFKGEN
jgi:hypothetical protein